MEAPEKIYLIRNILTSTSLNTTNGCHEKYLQEWYKGKEKDTDIEYTRTDAFIEKACEFLYNYNQKQVLKHGARATLGCGEYTINVGEFRKYMEGE